jgi:hypothetical protein
MVAYCTLFSFQPITSIFLSHRLQFKCADDNGDPNECQNKGPYLAGLNEEACATFGGTFCPAPADCTTLRNCIKDYFDGANKPSAYATYLEAAPNITDPMDLISCGRSREYFGFDEYFINDEQICEDVEQLRNTRDFKLLESFFGNSEYTSPTSDDDIVILPPNRGTSCCVF